MISRGRCRIEQLNRMCVALITYHVCNFDGARDHAYIYIYIYIAQEDWAGSSVYVSLCEPVCTYCVYCGHPINQLCH